MNEKGAVVVAAAEDQGDRIDRVLARHLADLTRSRLKSLILAGNASIDGRTIRDPAYRVNAGEVIAVGVPDAEPPEPAGENIPLNIAYEDEAVVVVDKPAGLVVHPGPGNWSGTLVNALIAHCGVSLSGIGGVRRPGIVHRLDKDTSGLLVVAKTDQAHAALSAQFADHGRTGPLQRSYLAFAWGVPDRPRGTISAPIDRHPHQREKMAVRPGGREAITHWTLAERYQGASGEPVASLLSCDLETGRTHQIRVHLGHIGHPLLGDPLYGAGFKTKAALLSPPARDALERLGRQALHAAVLGFENPATHTYMEFNSPLPPELDRLRAALDDAANSASEGRNGLERSN